MSGLIYIGTEPSDDADVERLNHAEETLSGGIGREYADIRVAALLALRSTKTYIDNQDATFAAASYYATRDSLLVPLAHRGAANGVATLDATSKVPIDQIPVIGGVILKGPWGADQGFGGTTGPTPLKIAQWNLGVLGVTGIPLVWMSTSVQSTGRPVVEIRMGTSDQTAYGTQTLVGRGVGRTFYQDYQTITVTPSALLGEGQDGIQDEWEANDDLLLNAWLFDSGSGGLSTTTSTSIASAALFMARTAL